MICDSVLLVSIVAMGLLLSLVPLEFKRRPKPRYQHTRITPELGSCDIGPYASIESLAQKPASRHTDYEKLLARNFRTTCEKIKACTNPLERQRLMKRAKFLVNAFEENAGFMS